MRAWILSSSVLILAVLLLRWVLRGKVNPRTQYALWLLVLVRLVLPFSLFSSGLSIQNVSDQLLDRPEIQQFHEKTDTPVLPEEDPGELPGISDGQATDDPVIQTQQNPVFVPQDRNPQQNPAVSQNDSQQLPQIPETPVQTEPVSLGAVLFRVWIGGMGLMALWMIGCNVHFAAGLRKSRRRLDIPQSPIEVYITKKVETPCLFGLFSPAVYLTPEAAEDRQVMGYVLTHELTHYRQFDYVWSLLRGLCLVIHWYNPLVWVAFRASRQDCEMACDEGTLKQLGEAHRGDYGRTLIALATQTRLRGTMLAATTMADGKKAIRERIVILMKNPKTALITMVALILVCALIVGCTFTGPVEGSEPEETIPVETTQPEETTMPEETAGQLTERDQRMEKAGFVRLDRLLEGTDIRIAVDGETITLSEDGLVLEFSPKSLGIRRNGFVVAAMEKMPRLLDGVVYVYEQAAQTLFVRESGISLFHGTLFFPDEILNALNQSDASAFHQKLLKEVLLPTSMGIETPHIDMDRVFQSQPLSELPEELAEELENLGYENPEHYTYSEYTLLSGAQTMKQANMIHKLTGPEWRDEDPNQVSVAEYTAWERSQSWQTYVDSLSEEEKAFAQEKGIELEDLSYLDRLYNGAYLRQTDAVLKQTLEEYYAAEMSSIGGQYTEPDPVSPHPGATQLTAKQIEQVNEAFVSTITDENNFTSSTSISCFFTSFYSDPRDIDLEAFLRYFSAEAVEENWDGAVDDEEFAVLCQLENFPWKGIKSLQEMHVPVHKYPARVVDQVVYRYTGIRLNDLQDAQGRGSALYSSKYDNYYNFTSDFGPGIFRCVDGYIYDDYVVLYSADAVLTLTERNGRYYIYSHIPIAWIEGVKLTAEQVEQVNEAFKSIVTWEENGVTRGSSTAISCFFTSYYGTPEQLDLSEFLRYFSPYGVVEDYDNEIGEAEFRALKNALGDSWPMEGIEDYETFVRLDVPVHKMPCNAINAVLKHYAGITLEDLVDQYGGVYFEEYDAYYNYTSDFGPGSFKCIGGMDHGTYVELYSNNSILTLIKEGNRYYIVSHLPKVI